MRKVSSYTERAIPFDFQGFILHSIRMPGIHAVPLLSVLLLLFHYQGAALVHEFGRERNAELGGHQRQASLAPTVGLLVERWIGEGNGKLYTKNERHENTVTKFMQVQ